MTAQPIVLKVLLRARRMQTYTRFCREYDRIATSVDPSLRASWPSKAQFYRWLSGGLIGLPYEDHCRILEGMFPGWRIEQLFQLHDDANGIPPAPYSAEPLDTPHHDLPQASSATSRMKDDVVGFYPHRADTPKRLWMDLLVGAQENVDLFANASLFLPEENPTTMDILKEKAANGTKVRILLGDPDHPTMELRGREERLFDAIPGRIRMALAYYRPLIDVDGVEFRLHGTSLYNSIFRYDDEMLVNQHIYGTYGYIAPILHLRRMSGADLFETYLKSFELVWHKEAYDLPAKDKPTTTG